MTPDLRCKTVHLLCIVLAAFAGPQFAQAEDSTGAAGAPYENILVIFLSESFDSRRYLETEIVKALAKEGTTGVRSTSMMNSRVPLKRETFLAMVDEIGADAVLVSQLANLKTRGTVVDMSPRSTYNIRPTYWFNVYDVELTEYVAPQAVNWEHDLSLAIQLYSVQSRDVVWAMESDSKIKVAFDKGPDYSIYVDEAHAIVKELHKSGMIAR